MCDPFPPKRKSHLLNREYLGLRHTLQPLRVPFVLFIFQETSLSLSISCRVVFSVCELVPQVCKLVLQHPNLPRDTAASKIRPHAPHEISNIVVALRAISLLCCHRSGYPLLSSWALFLLGVEQMLALDEFVVSTLDCKLGFNFAVLHHHQNDFRTKDFRKLLIKHCARAEETGPGNFHNRTFAIFGDRPAYLPTLACS